MKRYRVQSCFAVDDNEHNLFTLRALVEKHAGRGDPPEARRHISGAQIAQAQPDIDLIILDVQMPRWMVLNRADAQAA